MWAKMTDCPLLCGHITLVTNFVSIRNSSLKENCSSSLKWHAHVDECNFNAPYNKKKPCHSTSVSLRMWPVLFQQILWTCTWHDVVTTGPNYKLVWMSTCIRTTLRFLYSINAKLFNAVSGEIFGHKMHQKSLMLMNFGSSVRSTLPKYINCNFWCYYMH